MSDPAPECPAIAPGCLQTHPDAPHPHSDVERVTYAYAPLKALVDSRGVTLHAAVAKARGMRAAMLARRNTKGVRTSTVRGAVPAPIDASVVQELARHDVAPDHAPDNDDVTLTETP